MNLLMTVAVFLLSQLLFVVPLVLAAEESLEALDKSAPSDSTIYPVLPSEPSKGNQVWEFTKKYVAPLAVATLAIVGVIGVVKFLLGFTPGIKDKIKNWNPIEDLNTKITDLSSEVNSLKYGYKHDVQKWKDYKSELKQTRFRRQAEKINELTEFAWSSLESYECQQRFFCELGSTLSWSDTVKRITSVVEGFSPSRVAEGLQSVKSGLMEPTGCKHYVCKSSVNTEKVKTP